LISKSHVKSFVPGELVIPYGQPGRFLGIVVEGEAEAVITSKTGERIRLGFISQGHFLGEMSLLTGEPTSADVIALKRCEIFLIPQKVFTAVLAVNAQAVQVLAKTITERLKSRQQSEEEQTRIESAWANRQDPYGLDLSTAAPEKILVINCGSSSLKFHYFDTASDAGYMEGMVEPIGHEGARIVSSSRKGKTEKKLGKVGYEDAFKAVVAQVTDKKEGVIGDLSELSATACFSLRAAV
jgi:acetate kinase